MFIPQPQALEAWGGYGRNGDSSVTVCCRDTGEQMRRHLRNSSSSQHTARLKEPWEIIRVGPWGGRKWFLSSSPKLDPAKWHSTSPCLRIKHFPPRLCLLVSCTWIKARRILGSPPSLGSPELHVHSKHALHSRKPPGPGRACAKLSSNTQGMLTELLWTCLS